jgi:hypothetical protein
MRTVADFKKFILRWLGCETWKDLWERDEYRGRRINGRLDGYFLGDFWHELHQLGNSGSRRIEAEITESDRNTPILDSMWNELWVRAYRLNERYDYSDFDFLNWPIEETLERLLRGEQKHEEFKKVVEDEWEKGQEVGTFFAHITIASSFNRFLNGYFDCSKNSKFRNGNAVVLATEPEPPLNSWSELIIREAWHSPQLLGKWTGRTRQTCDE